MIYYYIQWYYLSQYSDSISTKQLCYFQSTASHTPNLPLKVSPDFRYPSF